MNDDGYQSLSDWLESKSILRSGFDLVVKGQHQPRHFIPLFGQELEGKVISLVEDETGIIMKEMSISQLVIGQIILILSSNWSK